MDVIDRNLHIAIWEWVNTNPGRVNCIDTIVQEFIGSEGEDEVIIAVAYLVEHGNVVLNGASVMITDECKPAEPA